MKIVFLFFCCVVVVMGAVTKGRQQVITLQNNSTPSAYPSQPDLIPIVVDTNPTTTTTPTPIPTTLKPNVTTPTPDEEEDSSEEEEEEDNEESDDQNDFSGFSHRTVLIPGYMTSQGELLVPIDAVDKDIKYEVIEEEEIAKEHDGEGGILEENDVLQDEEGVKEVVVSVTPKANEEGTEEGVEEEKPVESVAVAAQPQLQGVNAVGGTNEDDEIEPKRRIFWF